ncbi:MAG: SpoVR family protein [Desulfatiglans sp.]|jgi:stage V sporulation protein R|nr:SpoVR family protein [Desulfatiglans sp.]
MELIDQRTKKIMEGCKERAADAGLRFQDESLEYIVTNRDLLELSPKAMIPTLYDYWVHEVDVLKEKGKYELYPTNPYETVINTRPAISFYNDNNPDWLNVMIFYHVLAHVDFFQNNLCFSHTWGYDFAGEALSDKRVIANLRAEHGRWVDYVIEFSRGIDNLVGFHHELSKESLPLVTSQSGMLNYYFDVFLQSVKHEKVSTYIKEIERYNKCLDQDPAYGERTFFLEVKKKYPEFDAIYMKSLEEKSTGKADVIQFLIEHSEVFQKDENVWMKTVLEIVRKTSLFFQPQIRTKIMNEGWASFWHETLFLEDDRIKGHEVDFARVNAGVTAMPRVGLNPYALGMRLFYYIKEMVDKGKYSVEFRRIMDAEQREQFDSKKGTGLDFLFRARRNYTDFTFVNAFVDQDFVSRYKLFVAGKRLNKSQDAWEYYVKSRKAEDYKEMLVEALYHPPHVEIDQEKSSKGPLYLVHHFEGKPLVKDFITNTLIGIEYLWGRPVQLETSEIVEVGPSPESYFAGYMIPPMEEEQKKKEAWRRILYTMKDRKLTRRVI